MSSPYLDFFGPAVSLPHFMRPAAALERFRSLGGLFLMSRRPMSGLGVGSRLAKSSRDTRCGGGEGEGLGTWCVVCWAGEVCWSSVSCFFRADMSEGRVLDASGERRSVVLVSFSPLFRQVAASLNVRRLVSSRAHGCDPRYQQHLTQHPARPPSSTQTPWPHLLRRPNGSWTSTPPHPANHAVAPPSPTRQASPLLLPSNSQKAPKAASPLDAANPRPKTWTHSS